MKKGFTLIELLVVIIIIAILSFVLVPMYQNSVDVSRFSTMLTPTRAIKDAQEVNLMGKGIYLTQLSALNVKLNDDTDLTYDLKTIRNNDDYNVIRSTHKRLEHIRAARYFDQNKEFNGQLHCEARTGNDRANKICRDLLDGKKLMEMPEGFTSYLLDQEIDEKTCKAANLSWSSVASKCFQTEEERCVGQGMSIQPSGKCGYTNTKNQVIGDGEFCIGTAYHGCNNSIINDGGTCEGGHKQSCLNTTINSGGTCLGINEGHHGACANATINDGGFCIAEGQDNCMGSVVNEGGTCWAKGTSSGSAAQNFMCKNVTLNGGTCLGEAGSDSCYGAIVNDGGTCDGKGWRACYGATINDGGVCNATGRNSCISVKVNDGGKCIANVSGSCKGTYTGTGCCEGKYCPSDVRKC